MARGGKRKQAAERRRMLMEMKQAGASNDDIASQLGYKDGEVVATIVRQELRRVRSRRADEVRDMLDLRLEEAFMIAHHEMVSRRTGWAIDRVLAVTDRIARLHGAEAPQKVAVHVLTAEALERANAGMQEDLDQLPADERAIIEAQVLAIGMGEGPATDGSPTGSERAAVGAFDVVDSTTADAIEAEARHRDERPAETPPQRIAIESGRPAGYR